MREADPGLLNTRIDLTNCDREPIHILGNVQSFGCLIAVSSDWMVVHASENCGAILGRDAPSLIGERFFGVFPERTVHDLRSRIQFLGGEDAVARLFRYDLMCDGGLFDVSIHRSGRLIVFEFEPRVVKGAAEDDAATVQALMARVRRQTGLEALCHEAARGLRALTGIDRVMVYKFNEDDSGTVLAEDLAAGQEPYLGLRYPASDIPKQARALYMRSPLRLIGDVDGEIHPVVPATNPDGEPLDLSLAVTRAVSPIHLEYLRNMGVQASMSVSILRKGALWGLFACHHRAPFHLSYERRSAVELFVQLFSYELAQLENEKELSDINLAREVHDRLMSQLSEGQSLIDLFPVVAEEIERVIRADGIAVYSNGDYVAQGSAPTQEEFLGLSRFLNTTQTSQVFATHALSQRYEKADGFEDRAAGLLAIPISRTPRDYLVVFRREIAASVNWAGNPEKPVELGPNGARLTPRKSFDAWREVVRGTCAPWTPTELRAAEALRVTLLEVVLKISDEANAARKRAQEQQELLIAELNHRVRNILNLIRGLISQGRGDAATIDDYSRVLDDRIHALARAHDQLTRKGWGWVSFASLLETEVEAFISNKADRFRLSGDSIELSATAFTTLALVIHELVTNSAKYGALSDNSGNVDVSVAVHPDGSTRLRWRESGGPAVQAPTRKGFGTTIIERSIPFELKGRAEVHFRMPGLEAEFLLPASHVRQSAPTPQAVRAREATDTPDTARELTGSALIVEDNMIIALDTSDMLSTLGADQIQTAPDVRSALKLLEEHAFGFAVLDVNLGEETSLPVAEACVARGIPFVLATGYGDTTELRQRYPAAPIISKPYTEAQIREALSQL